MDVSTEQDGQIWLNQALGVPVVPQSRRPFYPFSRSPALLYRLKLGVVLANAGVALWRVEDPCHRFSLLLNCWLLWVTCEAVFRNYPWREPLAIWWWRVFVAVPCPRLLLSASVSLLLLASLYLGAGCELAHPLVAVTVSWLCCMMAWPRIRDSWHPQDKTDLDYDQFSARRPLVLLVPRPLRVMFAALHSPSLLALGAAFVAASAPVPFLPGAPLWRAIVGGVSLGCLALCCCHALPAEVVGHLEAWEEAEAAHARHVEQRLRMIKFHLQTSGAPLEDERRFDGLAVLVPLLVREKDILRNFGRGTQEMQNLATERALVEFRNRLDAYGPYTTRCCIS